MELIEQTEKKDFPSSSMEITTLNEIKGELDKILKAINALHNSIIKTNNPINEEIIEKDSDKIQYSIANTKLDEKQNFYTNQNNCQVSNTKYYKNATNEKIQINAVLKNFKTSNFQIFSNMRWTENYITNNIIRIWQNPNFLTSSKERNTKDANDTLESKMLDTTFLGSNAMNFPAENEIKSTDISIREICKNIVTNTEHQKDIHNVKKTLNALEVKKKRGNKNLARRYSFCYGTIPYTTSFNIFTSFATEKETPTKEDETAPYIITGTEKPTQESKQESHNWLDHKYKCIIPEIDFPWKPKQKMAIHTSIIENQFKNLNQPQIQCNNKDKNETDLNRSQSISQDIHPDIFLNETRSITDQKIDRAQEFNDKLLQSNGFRILSFMTSNKNSQIYAGAMITELEHGIFMYICKPCDMAIFDQTNFLIHLTTPKHLNNTNTWIQQHYILQEPQYNSENEEPIIMRYKNSLKGSNSELKFNTMMEIIKNKELFPEKHKVEVAFLITKFFTAKDRVTIQFTQAFKEAQNDQGQNHWIISAFEKIQQEHDDTRQYLVENSTNTNFDFFNKSPMQKLEVEVIADLARILFQLLVGCDFIPTEYLIILSIIKCKEPNLQYPQSKSELFNNYQIDLLLEEGVILLIDKNKASLQKTDIKGKDSQDEHNPNTEINTIQQKWIQLVPSYKKFMDHCNSKTFDWKSASFMEFTSELQEWNTETLKWTSTQINELIRQMLLVEETNIDPKKNKPSHKKEIVSNKCFKPPTKGIKQINDSRKRSIKKPYMPLISRDMADGNLPNFCQAEKGRLMYSSFGEPLCNYCGRPSHRRQHCTIKQQDRKQGFTRKNHPDKDSNIIAARKEENVPWHPLAKSYPKNKLT